MQNFDLSDEEFNDMKNTIIDNVIVGKDVFNKTTPLELSTFKAFISKITNIDVVVDGLNVAFTAGDKQHPSVTSNLVYIS